jgi:Tol biopolymer transport system component
VETSRSNFILVAHVLCLAVCLCPFSDKAQAAGVKRLVSEKRIASAKGFSWEKGGYRSSPDGRRIAYLRKEGEERVCLVLDGNVEGEFKGIYSDSLTFSPDSRRFACWIEGDFHTYAFLDGRVCGELGEWVTGESFFVFSRDGRHVAYRTGVTRMRIVVNGKEQEEYGLVGNPVFSPDGGHIAYLAAGNYWKKWFCVVDGRPGAIYDEALGKTLVFSPDGRRTAFAAKKEKRWFLVIDGTAQKGQFTRILNDPVAFSPDSRHVAFAAQMRPKWFVVLDGRSAKKYDEVTAPVYSPDGSKLVHFARSGMKWFLVTNRRGGRRYDSIERKSFTFSPVGSRTAFLIRKDGGFCAVVDDREEGVHDFVGPVVFSPDGKSCAYTARDGKMSAVFLNGEMISEHEEVEPQSLSFSPLGKHLAFAARKGKTWLVVVDGNEGRTYDAVLAGKRGGIFFPSESGFRYFACRKGVLFLVEEELE